MLPALKILWWMVASNRPLPARFKHRRHFVTNSPASHPHPFHSLEFQRNFPFRRRPWNARRPLKLSIHPNPKLLVCVGKINWVKICCVKHFDFVLLNHLCLMFLERTKFQLFQELSFSLNFFFVIKNLLYAIGVIFHFNLFPYLLCNRGCIFG